MKGIKFSKITDMGFSGHSKDSKVTLVNLLKINSLTLEAPTPQNGQTHSNNSSPVSRGIA